MLLKFIRKYLILFYCFIGASISIFLIQYPLSNIQEIWKYGLETGKVIYDISIGFIVSYLFFYVVVFIKEENDKKNINKRVSIEISLIIIEGYSIFHNLIKESENKVHQLFPPSLEQIEKYCLKADPYHSPLQVDNRRGVSWIELLRNRKNDTKISLLKILQLIPYLDSCLVGILTKIEDCGLFYQIDNIIIPSVPTNNFKDLITFKNSFFEYFKLISELESYTENNFNEFDEHKKMRDEKKLMLTRPY